MMQMAIPFKSRICTYLLAAILLLLLLLLLFFFYKNKIFSPVRSSTAALHTNTKHLPAPLFPRPKHHSPSEEGEK